MSEHVFFNNGLVDVASIYPVSISIEQDGISATYENVTTCSGMYPLDKVEVSCKPFIKKVIFNPPCTIVLWSDDTKTIVRTQNNEKFDPEKGLAMAITKKALGNTGHYFDEIKMWTEPYLEKNKDSNQVLSDEEEADYTNVY